MFLTEDDRRTLYRHSLIQMRESVEGLLDNAVRHETDMKLHGGVFWKLTARRMLFDYARIGAAVEAYRASLEGGLRDGHVLPEDSRDVYAMMDAFGRVSDTILAGARRGLKSGKTLASVAEEDPGAPGVIGKMVGQELEGDANVIDRLKDVTSDAFPALYSREEFLDLQGFYEEQPGVIAELAAANKRFRAKMPEHMRKEQQASIAKLKRNHARIMRMLDKAFLMFE
jgi:hypothetical protein